MSQLQGMLRCIDEVLATRPLQWAGFALRETTNFLLPSSCAVCSRADHRLCSECRAALSDQLSFPPVREAHCQYLELPALQTQMPVVASGIYANELARAILAFKDHQRYFLCSVFAPYLAASANISCVPQESGHPTLLVPMPSSLKSLGKRGYRPVESMLSVANRRGLLDQSLSIRPLLHYQLGQSFSGAQKSKSGSARRGRRVRLIAELPRVRQQPILLVDDVMTTGSTLQNAALSCNQAGYTVLGAVVLALTRPPSDESE